MKERIIAAAMMLTAIIFAVILFEIFLGIFYFERNDLSRRDLALMAFYAEPNSELDGVKINSHGFTGDEVDHQKPAKTLRILTLGGSTLFNVNITEKLKESIKNNTNLPIEILGGGIRSHTSASSVIKYLYLRQYDFDAVLLYDNINDLWVNAYDPADFRLDYSHYMHQYKRNILLNNCVSCRIIYAYYVHKDPEKKEKPSGYMSASALEKNIRELVRLIREDGATPVLMTFAYYIPDGYTDEEFMLGSAGYSDKLDPYGDYWPIKLWGDVEYVRKGLDIHNTVIRRVAAELQVDLIDQESLFDSMHDNKYRLFGDVCHFTPEGTGFFASNVGAYFGEHQHLLSMPLQRHPEDSP